MPQTVLTGGLVIDGTGGPPRRADITVTHGRITSIDPTPPEPGANTLDVSGLTLCPGFVDIHSHSDLTLLSNPLAHSKIRQGVTTEVVGNCGLGLAPMRSRTDRAALRQANSYLDLDPAVDITWTGVEEYLAVLEQHRPAVNVMTLTGHIPLRIGAMGLADRPADPGEIARQQELLAESFAAGSAGLSTGLVYPPTCYAGDEELLALGRTTAAHDRLFAWHVRDYADALIPSVRQAVAVARATGCRTQISHLTAVGRRNWGSVSRALQIIDTANEQGCRITLDIYPYLHGNAPLAQLLPSWAQAGGAPAMARQLTDPAVRARVRASWLDRPTSWDEITVNWVPAGARAERFVGRDIAAIAEAEDRDPDVVALDLLAALGPSVMMVAGGRSEADLVAALDHPAAIVASDGQALDPDGPTGGR